MKILIGKQLEFIDIMKNFLELEYDSVETYTEAIKRLNDKSFQEKLWEFKTSHQNRIREIRTLLSRQRVDLSDIPNGKKVLKIGKEGLKNISGDIGVLLVLSAVKEDASKRYEKISNYTGDKYPEVKNMARQALEYGILHKLWIDKKIGQPTRVFNQLV